MYLCMHACMYVCMPVCTYACMHVYISIYEYIHSYLQMYRYMDPWGHVSSATGPDAGACPVVDEVHKACQARGLGFRVIGPSYG